MGNAPRPSTRTLLGGLALCALAAPVAADRLITNDGRILEVEKARQLPDGSYQLVFESGEIPCPKRFVASVEVEGDMSDYVPADENERKKLADGYVRYRGKWLAKAAYLAELEKQAALSKARTAEISAHSKFHDGWEKETQHFRFKTNTSPELLDYYAELLEAYYDLMDQRMGIKPSPTLRRTKMQVNIYKSREEFMQLTKSEPDVLGFFSFAVEELQFFHDYQDPSQSEWVALHEGTHLLTYLIEPQAWPQIWVNEGVADYFGSSRISRDKKGKLVIEPGQIQIDRVLTVQQALQDGDHVPLSELFFVGGEEFTGFEYSHAWSFVYFLNNSKYEPGFRKFFKDFYGIAKSVEFHLEEDFPNQQGTAKVVPPAEVQRLLLDKLGVKDGASGLAKLEQEWLAFVAAIPLDAPRARFERGLATLYEADEDEVLAKGLEDVEAGIQGGVTDPRAYWARGMLHVIVSGDEEKATLDFRQAVELAPLDAGYRANLAQLLAGLSLHTSGFSVGSDEEVEKLSAADEALGEAELHFGLACELEPENEVLRESRERFLDLLQQKSGTK
ncbi:MAG: DUF1570 domain-containing protein [Planctomycetes bacterium]|nr:DUF1570 domain-containing protein [Planctomycetota bacterium]